MHAVNRNRSHGAHTACITIMHRLCSYSMAKPVRKPQQRAHQSGVVLLPCPLTTHSPARWAEVTHVATLQPSTTSMASLNGGLAQTQTAPPRSPDSNGTAPHLPHHSTQQHPPDACVTAHRRLADCAAACVAYPAT